MSKLSLGATMSLRKIVTTIIVAAMLFWAPSVIPARAIAVPLLGCGLPAATMITVDTAFAGLIGAPLPCPPVHAAFPWFVVIFGAGVVSVIVNAAIVGKNSMPGIDVSRSLVVGCPAIYWHRVGSAQQQVQAPSLTRVLPRRFSRCFDSFPRSVTLRSRSVTPAAIAVVTRRMFEKSSRKDST